MKMIKSRLYPIVAGISDFYFLSFVLGALVAFGGSIIQSPIPILISVLSILLLSILGSILYHTILAKRILWLSPGEQLVGRVINDQEKFWTNPYGYSRWALFLMILLTLLVAGNTWDRLSEGYIYSVGEVGMRIIILILLSYGLISMGKGRLRSVVWPIVYFLYLAISIVIAPLPTMARDGVNIVAGAFIVGAFLYFIIALIYHFLSNRKRKQITVERIKD